MEKRSGYIYERVRRVGALSWDWGGELNLDVDGIVLTFLDLDATLTRISLVYSLLRLTLFWLIL
jgi:hypothetical protein